MKKQYIQPQMLVVEMELTGNLMTGSLDVSDKAFDTNPENMTPLGRESVWGNEEGEEESKFWF